MRIFPILVAICVAVALYFFVMERDKVLALAGKDVDEVVTEETVEEPNAEPKGIAVVAVSSSAMYIENGITLRGETEAARFVDVKAETSGQVVSEPLRKGAFVKKGRLLCELDPGTRRASLAEADARLKEAELNERVASKLASDGYGSENTKTSAQAALRAAAAAYERAQEEIKRLTIVAPFEGLLESDAAEIGALLQPGSLCATIIQLDPIKIVGFVPEVEINLIEVGSNAFARLVDGREVAGKVTYISRSADPTTRTFRLEVKVANEDLGIRDGSTAEIFIASRGEMAHLLPQSSLTLDDSGAIGVRTAVDGKAIFFAVDIVRDSVEGIWVTGLPDQVNVIVVGQEFVIDGSPVVASFRTGET